MAEYIDRNLIEWYGCDLEKNCEDAGDCDSCADAECNYRQVMQIPTADVVDRENVKNLIKVAIEDNWELDYALERLKGI